MAEATPIECQGVRYEAPYWGPPGPQSSDADKMCLDLAGLPLAFLSPEELLARLSEHGLHPAQADPGGWLVARDAVTQEVLWQLRLFSNEETFITDLEIDGDYLLVVDESRRVFRVHRQTRTVEELPKRHWPEVPPEDYPIYEAALAFVIDPAGTADLSVFQRVDAFPHHGGILQEVNSGRILHPDLEAAQASRLLLRPLTIGQLSEATPDSDWIHLTRVARIPETGEALVTLIGSRVGSKILLIHPTSPLRVTEVRYQWEDGPLDSEALPGEMPGEMSGVMPGMVEHLTRAVQFLDNDELRREMMELLRGQDGHDLEED